MNNSFQITGVRVIPVNAKVARPLVVFSVANHADIVLAPSQALIGLQNSGRAVGVIDPMSAEAQETYYDCIGAVLTADITYHKAGDFYVIDETHPAITGKTKHELAGQVKVGDKIAYKEDGMRIEGFITVPLTFDEKVLRNASRDIAKGFLSRFGVNTFAMPSSAPVVAPANDLEETPFEEVTAEEQEAFGKPSAKAPKGTK